MTFALAATACDRSTKAPEVAPSGGSALPSSAAVGSAAPTAARSEAPVAVGKPAPDFTLSDLDGRQVSLSSFKGKTVVLEWFNPQCPYVKASHQKGSLVSFAQQAAGMGVVWLAINSGAPGKQGHGVEANRAGATSFNLDHPILLDESGDVGRMYGATNTPHMVVIDKDGNLAYRGAIDNSPDGEGQSPKGGKLVNYVEQALTELAAGKKVTVPESKAYGCSVKYKS